MEPITNLENEEIVEVIEPTTDGNLFDTFVPEPKIIYAILNDEGYVTQLVSSIFITEQQLQVARPIDSGEGDNYVHVGEYTRNILGKDLFDNEGCANFYIENTPVTLSEQDELVMFTLLERTLEDKQAEIAKRPVPPVIPTVQEVATIVTEMVNTVSMLSDAMVEVDNSSSEADITVEALSNAIVEVDGKTTETELTVQALSEALVEVDNRAINAEAALTERRTDTQIIMEAIVELSEAIAAIQQKLDIE